MSEGKRTCSVLDELGLWGKEGVTFFSEEKGSKGGGKVGLRGKEGWATTRM